MFNEFDFQIDNFMMYCDSKSLSRKTKKSYEQTLRLFSIYLRKEHTITDPREVKPVHIRSYIKYLKLRGKYTVVINTGSTHLNNPEGRSDHSKQISDTTVGNYIRNIKVFFNFLKSEHEIGTSPASTIANIKPDRKKKKLLSLTQIKQLLNSFDTTKFHGYRNWVTVRTLLDTGMRIGECLGLRPDDLDFRARAILITNPKNRKERYAFISDKLSKDLRRWLQYRDRYSDSEYLFPTTRGNKQDVTTFEKVLKKAGEEVNIEVTPHQLRNNFAKYYLLNGGDYVTLSRILGHSSVEVTQKAYLDFTEDEIAKKYQKHSPLNNFNL
ncbi:tyrosine-type recombinase/integrase [Bacillus velezensis]|uniref:tyrosine-type recombinase/integrase n=1 Tax=Bacillus velezensis TaxID=492670 RepID=UPI003CFFD050